MASSDFVEILRTLRLWVCFKPLRDSVLFGVLKMGSYKIGSSKMGSQCKTTARKKSRIEQFLLFLDVSEEPLNTWNLSQPFLEATSERIILLCLGRWRKVLQLVLIVVSRKMIGSFYFAAFFILWFFPF